MKIIDILQLVTEESEIVIYEDYEEVAKYDGKESIPKELNDRDIIAISSGYYRINIDI